MSSVFFFSSRRRHTRCGRDWSSDVCSSDLEQMRAVIRRGSRSHERILRPSVASRAEPSSTNMTWLRLEYVTEIGRASCRERVEISVVAVSLKEKKNV